MNLLFKNNKKLNKYELILKQKYRDDIILFTKYSKNINNYFIYRFVYCLYHFIDKLDDKLYTASIDNVSIEYIDYRIHINILDSSKTCGFENIYPQDIDQLRKVLMQILNNIHDIDVIEYKE